MPTPLLAFAPPIDDSDGWIYAAGVPVGAPPADKHFYRDTTNRVSYQRDAAGTDWEVIPSDAGIWVTGAADPVGAPAPGKFYYLNETTLDEFKANAGHTAWDPIVSATGIWDAGAGAPVGAPSGGIHFYRDTTNRVNYQRDLAGTAWEIVPSDAGIWLSGAGAPVGAPPADKDFYRDRTNRTSWQKSADGLTWEQITDDLSGRVYDIPAPTPFSRSPQQSDFQSALDADVAGAQTYVAGDELQIITATDGHYFSTRIIENSAAPGTLTLRPMQKDIPFGLEFTAIPGNRDTYHEGFPIVVNSIDYKMQSGAWTRVSPPGGSTSTSGTTVIPLTFDAGGIAKSAVPAALEAAHPAATDGIYTKRRVTNIDPASVPNLEIVSPVFQVLLRSDGTNASLEWVEVV